MVQALGFNARLKYQVDPAAVVRLLRPAGLEWQYVRQLLFNMAIGNTDAHAKNYSIIMGSGSVSLAPLYDTLPIFLWPAIDQTMPIKVGGTRHFAAVTEATLVAFANHCGLDPARFLDESRRIFQAVADRLPDALSGDGFAPGDKDLAARFVRDNLLPHLPSTPQVRPEGESNPRATD